MSIKAVTDLAAERDVAGPDDPTAQFSDVLTKTIPTESLAAYTSFIALVQTQSTSVDPLLDWRWGAAAGFVVLTVLGVLGGYYRKARASRPARLSDRQRWGRWLPFELVPVLLATVAWGLAMPGGPLSVQLTGSTGALTLGAIVIVGGALVAATGTPLRTGTPTTPTAPGSPPGEPDEARPTPEPVPHGG